MDLKSIKTLEYHKILNRIADFATSSSAKKQIADILPFDEKNDIFTASEEVSEAYTAKYKFNANPIHSFDDCAESVSKANKGITLTPAELLRICRLLKAGRIAQNVISEIGDDTKELDKYVFAYRTNEFLENDIDRCIIGETEISDNASSALKDIRRKLFDKKTALKEKLSSYFRKSEYSLYLQDNLVTIRNDRFVLPVKSEYRSMVQGLIHDQSASGATVFVEPFSVVEMNNEIRSLAAKEEVEIENILKDLTRQTGSFAEELRSMQDSLTSLDVIFAKMNYSVSINGVVPKFNYKNELKLLDARHPLIDKDKVVPITIKIGANARVLMITGPNTGGKTVCLKTAGLLCLMAYTGLMIPCVEGSEVPIFDNIYCDIGDEQSIAESLSTFSSHVVNLTRITDALTNKSLLLFDELGGGTDPIEGSALAIGIIKYIQMFKATAIITTHYSALKNYALSCTDIINGAMQFNAQTLKPTYKLLIGVPGASNALKIAKSLGLNSKILEFAYSSIDKEVLKLEDLLSDAEETKRLAEEELSENRRLGEELNVLKSEAIQKQKALTEKLERLNANAKAEIKRIIANDEEKADELIEKIKEKLKEADEKAFFEAKALRKQLEDIKYRNDENVKSELAAIDPAKITKGKKVSVISLGAQGTIVDVDRKKESALISIGSMKTAVKFSDIADVEQPKPKQAVKKFVPSPKTEEYVIIPEVFVIGYTVSEAIELIEPHIINCHLNGPKLLRIVHGKGTGALGAGIQKYLKTSPLVYSYRYGGFGEGERGVTIAEIK